MGDLLADAENLKNTFFKLGYQVLQFRNLRAQQIEIVLSPEYLADQQQNGSLSQFASLVVCILAHGDKGIVYGVDGVPVLLNRIQHAFDLAPALKGKPKIHVIFACQGSNEQLIANETTNQKFVMSLPRTRSSSKYTKDSITLMATIEEFFSYCKLLDFQFENMLY